MDNHLCQHFFNIYLFALLILILKCADLVYLTNNVNKVSEGIISQNSMVRQCHNYSANFALFSNLTFTKMVIFRDTNHT